MKELHLPTGIHRVETITEPTTIIGDGPLWSTIITSPPDQPAVNVRAPVTVENCQIMGGLFGVKGQSDAPAPIVMRQCWLHHSVMSGVLAIADLEIDHCLIEYCGSSGQYDHGVYACGNTRIENSILWGSAANQFTLCKAAKLRVEDCLVVGRRGYYINAVEDVQFERVTFEGRSDLIDCPKLRSYGCLRTDAIGLGTWGFTDRHRRLYWLTSPVFDGAGCYPQFAQFGTDKPNDEGVAYAEKLWYLGYMFAYDGKWKSLPHFPGDPLPEVPKA